MSTKPPFCVFTSCFGPQASRDVQPVYCGADDALFWFGAHGPTSYTSVLLLFAAYEFHVRFRRSTTTAPVLMRASSIAARRRLFSTSSSSTANLPPLLVSTTHLSSWREANACAFLPPICNKLLHKSELSVMGVGGPTVIKEGSG